MNVIVTLLQLFEWLCSNGEVTGTVPVFSVSRKSHSTQQKAHTAGTPLDGSKPAYRGHMKLLESSDLACENRG